MMEMVVMMVMVMVIIMVMEIIIIIEITNMNDYYPWLDKVIGIDNKTVGRLLANWFFCGEDEGGKEKDETMMMPKKLCSMNTNGKRGDEI